MNLRIPLLSLALAVMNTNAGVIVTSSFNGVTNGAVSTVGLSDWGYVSSSNTGFLDSNLSGAGLSYNNTPYGTITRDEGDILTTVFGSSTIGLVTLTEGAGGTDTVGAQGNTSNYTFDGNMVYGSYGGFAPGEQDVWTLTLNDLGVGTFDITLYLGHSNTGRSMDMDVVLNDNGDITSTTTTTGGSISGLGSTIAAYGTDGVAYTYDITVTTTNANSDLSITFGDTSGGGFGGAIFGGYTVFTVPEPSTTALLGIGGFALLLRRRR